MRTRHGIAWLLFLCASILLPGAAWPVDASCASAPQHLDDWETASPEEVRLDAAVLCKITQELAVQGGAAARPDRRNVHAVLVVRYGKLVFETYAAGEDENWADPYRYILGREVVHEPDAKWQYNSGATMLLGAVLKKATGKSLDEFAKEALFDPLHIQDFEWGTMLNGDPAAHGGLRLRPRDTAKIGQLVLNGGTWQGQRIVPEDWVKRSTEPRFDTSWGGMQYGYHWWLGTSPFGVGRTVDWIAAWGVGGQRIFIAPRSIWSL